MIESYSMSKGENTKNQIVNSLNKISDASSDFIRTNPVPKDLSSEDCKNFVRYLDDMGIPYESNTVVLSSLHHYYYDADEMANVKTIINLKELNHIKELKDFLHSSFHILPSDCNFVGCFINNKKQSGFVLNTGPADYYYKRNYDAIEKGIASSSPFLNMIYNVIDSKTNKYLSERSVSLILAAHGFKVIDFTEIEGLTYFCAKSLRDGEI
jgi:hypothetical protein